ncbi:MAG: hypothetical protein RLZZ136_453 [Pseudomonadota bacterium]
MEIGVTSGALATVQKEAAKAAPAEACGLLLGDHHGIRQAVVCANVAADPLRHFEIDPAALIAAHRAARGGGPQVIGYWHSHPSGAAAPSATDRAMASGDGRIWASVAAGQVTFWRDRPEGFVAVTCHEIV